MSENKLPSFSLLLIIFASFLGTAIITTLLMQPTNYPKELTFAPTLIGSLYFAICVLGLFAVFYPKICKRTLMFQQEVKLILDKSITPKKVMRFRGHHPDCSKFSANRIKIRKTVLCAACSGLLIGAVVALIGTILYFFIGYNFLWSDPWILVVGNAGMLLGLFQFKFKSYVKLTVNALFVISSLLTLVMADILGKSLFTDLYVLGLIVFFLATRILLSEFYNKNICHQCKQCF